MKKKILMVVCSIALVLTTACGNPKLKNGEEVVVSVKGKEVSANELYEELKASYGYSAALDLIDAYIADQEVETTDEIKEQAQATVDQIVQIAAMYGVELKEYLAAYGINATTEEEFLDYMIRNQKVTVMIENWVKENLTDKEIEEYYKENYTEQLTVRHILIEPADSDKDGKEAKEKAEKLIKELGKVDKDKVEEKFTELAKDNSDDGGTYANGGLLEKFMASTVPEEFWEAASKLKDGEYTKSPVKSDEGYHIILRISSSEKPSLEDSKEEIENALVEEKLNEDANLQYDAITALRKKYNLKFYDKDLENSYNDFLKQLEEAKASSEE